RQPRRRLEHREHGLIAEIEVVGTGPAPLEDRVPAGRTGVAVAPVALLGGHVEREVTLAEVAAPGRPAGGHAATADPAPAVKKAAKPPAETGPSPCTCCSLALAHDGARHDDGRRPRIWKYRPDLWGVGEVERPAVEAWVSPRTRLRGSGRPGIPGELTPLSVSESDGRSRCGGPGQT